MISELKILGPEVSDTLFKVSEKCIRLRRNVQMYQWEEHTTTHSDDEGNSYTDTYHTKTWAGYRLHTTSFFYSNPDFLVNSAVITADGVGLANGLTLGKVFHDQINWKVKKSGSVFKDWNYYSRSLFSHGQQAQGDYQAIGADIPKVGELTKSQQGWLLENYSIGDYRVYWECLGEEGDTVSVLGEITDQKPDSLNDPKANDPQKI